MNNYHRELLRHMMTMGGASKPKLPFDFMYEVDNGGVSMLYYTGNETAIEIPSEHDGYPVTASYATCFCENSSVESIIFPNGLERIE